MKRAVRFSKRTVQVGIGGGLMVIGAAGAIAQAVNQPPASPSGLLTPSGAVVSHTDAPGDIAALPASYPDKFAWMLFLQVNQKAKQQWALREQPGQPATQPAKQLVTNNALWETWASDSWTFPDNPNPANPPQWPAGGQPNQVKMLKPRALAAGTITPAEGGVEVKTPLDPGGIAASQTGANSVGEEVFRNKVAFDYIINNGLWYREGIAAFFGKAAQAASDDVAFAGKAVNFPRDSIEVKGNWVVIAEKDKARYHWNYDAYGQLVGLVAMHIISKDLPNWFWCTFEHVDNPGRGDYIGIHDSFGANPAHTPSYTTQNAPQGKPALGRIYTAEKLTPQVIDLFAKSGFSGDWAEQFKNYRLKGSQTDFTDTAGRSLLLGNSVTEAGFVPTASCMTCHSRAAVNAQGASSFPFFGEQGTLPLIDQTTNGSLTYSGTPDPNWFYNFNGKNGAQLENLQTDFVWAIPMRAKSANKNPATLTWK